MFFFLFLIAFSIWGIVDSMGELFPELDRLVVAGGGDHAGDGGLRQGGDQVVVRLDGHVLVLGHVPKLQRLHRSHG